MKPRAYTEDDILSMFRLHVEKGSSISDTARSLGFPRTTVGKYLSDPTWRAWYIQLNHDGIHQCSTVDLEQDNYELVDESVRLAKKLQRAMDRNRIERKSFREFARADNMLLSLTEATYNLLTEHGLRTSTNLPPIPSTQQAVGVIQFSDLHFNELIRGIDGNEYNTTIASKRIRKHVTESCRYFDAHGIVDVVVAMTGDLMNSSRRISEITEAATSRAQAVFIAVDILSQAIKELASKYNVTVVSVTGNESRLAEFVDWTDFLANDNFDLMIHTMLYYQFRNVPRITVAQIKNPLECVVNIMGHHILLMHGHSHKGLASTNKIENEVDKVVAKYARRGINLSYVICGHCHSAYISDLFARSGGLPGSNAYSDRGLNLDGRASQNMFIVNKDGIHGIKIDLQNVDSVVGYPYDHSLETYHTETTSQTVIIQQTFV